jgi:hypothetical protein
MSKEYDEQNTNPADTNENEQGYVYKNVIKDKQHRRTWSVVSLTLAILSVVLTYFSWVGIVLALASGGAAALSRRNLGYFDKLSLASIFIAIFGLMFAITGLVFGDFIFAFLG